MEKAATVCCPPDNEDAQFAHPRVYASISKGETWTCPYCSRKFKG